MMISKAKQSKAKRSYLGSASICHPRMFLFACRQAGRGQGFAFYLLLFFTLLQSSIAGANIREGLVGWWRLDEASGATAIDWSGQNNNGTYNGTTAMPAAQCKRSGCRNFNGSSNYINIGQQASLNLTSAFTVSLWFNTNVLPGGGSLYVLFDHGYDGSRTQYDFSLQNDPSTGNQPALIFCFFDGQVHGTYYVYGGNIQTKTWYQATGTYDGSVWRIYLNGNLVASTTDATAIQSVAQNVTIGGQMLTGTPQRFFNGLIDDVRIYNRALTAQEVSDLYRSGIVLRGGVWRNAKFNQ